MIVDIILDRKDGVPYSAKSFYNYCAEEELSGEITRAMDFGTNAQVQTALCKYILDRGYNPEICNYIKEKNWIEDDRLNPMCEKCKCRLESDELGHICQGTTEQVWTNCIYRKTEEYDRVKFWRDWMTGEVFPRLHAN